jgi:hypothetical protein
LPRSPTISLIHAAKILCSAPRRFHATSSPENATAFREKKNAEVCLLLWGGKS